MVVVQTIMRMGWDEEREQKTTESIRLYSYSSWWGKKVDLYTCVALYPYNCIPISTMQIILHPFLPIGIS